MLTVEGTAVKGVVFMNRIFKVIFNRNRQLVQVVPEYAKNRGKEVSESRKGGVRGLAKVLLTFLATLMIASPGYAADETGSTGSGDTTYISDTNTEAQNIQALDKQVVKNAQDIAANQTTTTTNTNNIAANKMAIDKNTASIATNTSNIAANKTAIDKNTASIATNTSNIAANKTAIDKNTASIAANTTAISNETTARTNAINALETKLTSGTNTSLASKANVDASNIGTKIDTSSETTEEAKKKKQEDNAKLWGEALGIGTIADRNEELLTGGTLYTELRPSENGFYIYNGQSTAYNLLALDSAVNALGVEKITDNSGNITYVSNLYKYFKANPETTTNDDGTVTYAKDADAQGTNSVAIGPSAKVNPTGENGVAIGKGATTGADKYTKTLTDKTTTEVSAAGGVDSVSIGTNAASQGNDSVALGKGAKVLNDFDTSTNAAVVKTGDVAIGSGATVDSSLNSTAIGTSTNVRYGEDSLALGSSAKVDTAKQAVALGYKASVADGADSSLALGDEASAKSSYATAIGYKASANTASSIAMGNGANTGGDGGGIAIGTSATADGRSIAIGFSGTTTANNYDSVAIGNGAQANVDRSISIGLNAGTGAKADKGGNEGSLIAIGDAAGQNVAGLQNTAIGSGAGSGVKSSNNIALGSYAGSNITNVSDNNPQNGYNISIGYKANYSKTNQTIIDSLAIGRETSAITNGVALGATAKASGQNSVSLGFNAQSSGTDSMALGSGASAADGNVAIGSSSAAPAVSTLGTVKDDGNVYKAETSTDSSGAVTTTYTLYKSALTNIPLSFTSHYVSFGISDGNTTVNRRLSNVADGVFDQDAVTVKQLNMAYSSLQGLITGIDTSTLNTYSTDVIDSKEANLKAEIANSKYKYFSVNADSATSTGNQDNTGASSGGADAMAIGPNAYATATKSLAVGNNVSASGIHSIALGTSDNPTTTAGATTTHYTSSEGENSIAVGYAAIAQTDNSIAIGTRAVTYTADTSSTTPTKTGINSIAIGYETVTRKDYATAIGNSASAEGTESTALGNKTTAVGTESLAVGSQSTTNGDGSASIGRSNAVTGTDVAAVGSRNISSGSWGGITDSGLFGYTNKIQAYSDTNVSNTVTGVYILGSNNEVNQADKINKVTNVTLLGQGNSVTAGSNATSYQNTINNVTVIGGSNKVIGREESTTSWSTLENDTVLGYGNTIDASQQATPVSNIQILGNNVTATLGNSAYLGTGAAYVSAEPASNDAETLAVQQGDAEAEASDEYNAATTDTERNTIKQKYEAKYLYKARVAAMEAKGTTAGVSQYDQDNTYGNTSSYTYAAGTPAGVVTVGSDGKERRIQNVAAGLVSATSTDAVNGSQLYALTRQLRFGGDNSSFGTTTADDKNVVARGSNETLNIIGGEKDSTKLTDNNLGVVSDGKDTLTVKLSKNVNLGNDGSVAAGNTTLDTNGITITNGPKFTSSSIDAASQKITSVEAGEADNDAANVGQVKSARTLLTKGNNTNLADTDANGHHTYTVNVDNLAVKAANGNASVALANGINFKNGTNTTSAVDASGNVTIDTKNLTLEANGTNKASVSMDGGINFKNGTNTTATVDTDGTVTISATHNKLDSASYTASKPSDSSNQTTVKLKDTDGNETTLNLTDTYTTVSKNTDHTISFERNDGSNPVSISLDDLDGASNEALTKAAAKATTTVIKGTNVDSVDDDTTSADGHHIYKVNVSNLGVKVADGQKKSVALSEGLVFGNGTNTTASVGDNGAITFNVSNDAIKTQAKDAINMSAGSNVKVETTSTDGLSKTFTISATHNALKSATLTPKSNDVSTLTITGNDGDTASVDIKNTHLTVTKDSEAKTVTFTSNDGTTPETTLSLSDLGAASTADMNAAKAAASTEVKAGTNASLGTVETNQTDQHKIYTVNVDNLGLKQNGTAAGTVTLADGINFADGTNTSATVSNGKVTFDLKKDITNIDTITASNSIQAGNVKVGKQGADNKNYVTGLENKNWTVGQTTYEAGRAATEDQLKSVSDKVASGFQVTDGTTSANIGADKKVTFTNGNYTTAKVTQATDGANVQYDINTAKLTTGANGTITAPTTDGVATAANVAEAINSAAWKIKANDNDTTAIKAGTTVGLKAGNNLTLSQSGTAFTYALKDELTGIKSLTTAAQDGVTTTLAASGVTIASSGTGNKSVSLTANGLNNGGKQITNVASGGDTDTNAANISDVKRLVQASASGTTETGFNVKGDDATAKKVKLGKQLNVVGGTNDTSKLSDGNIGVVTKDDGQGNATLTVKLNKNINLDSVKAGNTTLDINGLAISGGPTIAAGGINAGGKTITGVANGVGDNDAVNISQLKAVQSDINAGWTIKGKDTANADVSANIGKGKTVTYDNGNYTKSVVTKDDSTGNATVKVDVTTGTFGSGAGDKAGTVTSTAKGLATTQDVANAINSAAINVVADNTPDNKTSVKAGDTIHFAKDGNLTLVQNGTTFTYGLNSEISISKVTTSDATNGSTVQDAKGITTTDAAGNTYIQNGQGITLTSSDKTKSPVKLTNTGLNNGGNKITGVGKGTDDADAVNVAQLKEVNDKVGSGWQIAGNDGQKVADIGAGKKVSFKTDSQYLTADTKTAGTDAANVTYGLKTKTLTAADGKVSAVDTAEDGLATAKNVAETINQTYWTAASGKSGSGSQMDETANPVDKQISAGDTVTFNAGNNLSLVQNGASFTYGLQANLTGMNTITFTPRNDADGHPISLVIGKQKDGVSNDEGYYITGLDNTSWNQSNYVKNRAATEAQLASAIQQVTLASQSGGFKLSDDNNNEVSQVLGQAIGVVGDSNITTTAETTTADPNGHIKVSLNKHIDLGTDGSLQAGGVTLQNNSVTVGTNGVVISSSGSERTVSNLSNIHWDAAKVSQDVSAGGYKNSGKAATEGQLAEAISTATSTAAQNEQHIRNGEYSVQTINNADGSKSQGVSIDIITGDGNKPGDVKGHVVIKDVAKASDVGDVSQLHDTLKNPDGTRNVTGAINNLDDRVTGLDNRMDKIYTTAGQHSSVSSESNIVVDHSAKNESGGTDYKLSLNKEKIDLKNVTIEGNAGAVTAKTVTAEKYNVGDKTYISSDGLNANSQKITNVQAGTADTDAANVGQVREADEQLAGGIAQNARNISQLGREVDKLDSRIDRVGAGAAALAALHPGAYDPNDKVDFSAGYGNYRGASAAAVGMYYHPDERTILSMGVAMGGGENMVNAGVTWKLGRRTPAAPQPVPVKAAPGAPALVPVSTAAAAPVRPVETAPAVRPVAVRTSVRPVETVAPVAPAARVRPVQPAVAPVRTADTNAQLMELLARQTAILEKLSEQKAVPAAAPAASGDDLFTDVPENHWAYECALKMEKAGVLKGLGGLQVEGNPLLTRKDFARILYTALKNGATTNPALNSDNSLNRMASEFRGELKMVKG
ncbi:MAG: YadA-like family protein [Acidaminococcus fermentans]|uniref:ESPR-type extended signal peptide-containing protein n=2 Tax=Acidaminococcus fermentans TaxID=905 RepID=UPI00242E3E69|nr:ESPR-type extended signal peptide-containing protein [Acidaminococcus fermentans]MCF0139401.1 YadA-like family protein [Acidaminococcus fermentans]